MDKNNLNDDKNKNGNLLKFDCFRLDAIFLSVGNFK